MLVAAIERQREQTFRSPFETVLMAIACFDDRAAVTGEHIDDFLKEMLLRIALGAGRKVKNKNGNKIAAAFEMHYAAFDAHARPVGRRHFEQIDAEILGD